MRAKSTIEADIAIYTQEHAFAKPSMAFKLERKLKELYEELEEVEKNQEN